MWTVFTLANMGAMARNPVSPPAQTGAERETSRAPAPTRERYHHGDLPSALLRAGVDLARQGGPDAVVLREATRRVGVSPNAAYRHFADRDALLNAVTKAAQAQLAQAIERELHACDEAAAGRSPADAARAHLRAVGTAYVRFALDEPGLFRAAFTVHRNLDAAADPRSAGQHGRTPFELLSAALDDYVAAGIMPAHRRPHAEIAAWAPVHGLAGLLTEGPLRAAGREQAEAMMQRVIDLVDAGLTAP